MLKSATIARWRRVIAFCVVAYVGLLVGSIVFSWREHRTHAGEIFDALFKYVFATILLLTAVAVGRLAVLLYGAIICALFGVLAIVPIIGLILAAMVHSTAGNTLHRRRRQITPIWDRRPPFHR